MAAMTEQTLKGVLAGRITAALGYTDDELVKQRREAEKYYRGDKFGNEEVGRSQVVSRDVAEAVDSMMPPLMKIFTAGDEVVRFDPRQPEDVEAAQQATDYVNYIWHVDNDGFGNFYTWFKDALMKKRGIVKIWWDKRKDVRKETYAGLTQAEHDILAHDPDIEIVEDQPYQVPGPTGIEEAYNCIVRRSKEYGCVKVSPVPPDEFLIDRRAIDDESAPFIGHRRKRTISDLIADGYDKAQVSDLGSGDEGDLTTERQERFSPEDTNPYRTDAALDSSMREVWVTECYIRVDYDGDGIAEMRKITAAGEGTTLEILDNEEIPDHPFATICPIPMPHKFWGQSIADVTTDVQLVKSTILRQILDNLYLTNAPQLGAVEGKVNLDDLLSRRAGGVVRMTSPDAIIPIPTQTLGSDPYNMLQLWDGIREQRTGVRRFAAGPGADALQEAYSNTLGGAQMVQDSSAERLELIARVFAETGVRRAMKLILRLVAEHQQEARMVRLRNEWVPMDPRGWDDGMDMSVSVGLGTGSRQSQMSAIMTLIGLDEKIVTLQGGVDGPILTKENVYAKLKKLCESAGFRDVETYYTDPKNAQQQPQQPKPDPKMIEVQGKMQVAQAQLQSDQQIAQQKAQSDMQQSMAELDLKRQQMTAEFELRRQQLAAEMELKREQMMAEIQLQGHVAGLQAQTQIASNVQLGGEPG